MMLMLAAVLLLTACVQVASPPERTPEGDGPRAATCGCDSLPPADPRVPWSDHWRDVRYRPDGNAVALVGLEDRTLSPSLRELPGLRLPPPTTVRADSIETVDAVLPGFHILEWRADGNTYHLPAPPEFEILPYSTGAWSPDGSYWAHVSRGKTNTHLVVCDLGTGKWNRVASIERWTVSTPTWSPSASEIAVAEAATTSSYFFRHAVDVNGPDAAPALARVFVVDAQGGSLRERLLSDYPDSVGTIKVAWSPDGRFLAVFGHQSLGGACDLRILEASSLDLLDSHRVDEAHCGEWGELSWSPDSRMLLSCSCTGASVLEISEDGKITRDVSAEQQGIVLNAAWCPGGQRFLISVAQRAPDLQEVFEEVLGAGHARTHRSMNVVRFYDAGSLTCSECEALRHVGREEWSNSWMIPRAAEAFALWAR